MDKQEELECLNKSCDVLKKGNIKLKRDNEVLENTKKALERCSQKKAGKHQQMNLKLLDTIKDLKKQNTLFGIEQSKISLLLKELAEEETNKLNNIQFTKNKLQTLDEEVLSKQNALEYSKRKVEKQEKTKKRSKSLVLFILSSQGFQVNLSSQILKNWSLNILQPR